VNKSAILISRGLRYARASEDLHCFRDMTFGGSRASSLSGHILGYDCTSISHRRSILFVEGTFFLSEGTAFPSKRVETAEASPPAKAAEAIQIPAGAKAGFS
jgi:hypothetical protein